MNSNLVIEEKVLNLITNNEPSEIDLNVIEFEFIDKKSNKLKGSHGRSASLIGLFRYCRAHSIVKKPYIMK